VAARGALISYRSVLQDRFCYVPLDVIVPGILQNADLPDVVAALAPRAVLLESPVDGKDRTVAADAAASQLADALTAYKAAPAHLLIRGHAAEREFAAWIATQLSR